MTDDDGRNEPIKVTPGFVMDWFMADRIEPELEGMSEAKAEFTRGVTELVLKHLAAYMRESEFVVYGPSLARIEEKRAAAGGDPE